jgi:hypothetical protein
MFADVDLFGSGSGMFEFVIIRSDMVQRFDTLYAIPVETITDTQFGIIGIQLTAHSETSEIK